MKEIEDFLRKKGLLADGHKMFVIKGSFGVLTLNDLLKEWEDTVRQKWDNDSKEL